MLVDKSDVRLNIVGFEVISARRRDVAELRAIELRSLRSGLSDRSLRSRYSTGQPLLTLSTNTVGHTSLDTSLIFGLGMANYIRLFDHCSLRPHTPVD